MSETTRLLAAMGNGDPQAADRLLPLVYQELRSLAHAHMARERAGHTLQATALLHEAYLRLVDQPQPRNWDGKAHFFAAATEAMRRILIDEARRKRRPKHGGDRKRVDLDSACSLTEPDGDEVLAVNEALGRLETEEPAKAQLVKLRYFAGFTLEESADLLNISLATAKRHWAYARAWLYAAIEDAGPAGS